MIKRKNHLLVTISFAIATATLVADHSTAVRSELARHSNAD